MICLTISKTRSSTTTLSKSPARERIVKGVMTAILSILLSGGLYFAIRLLE